MVRRKSEIMKDLKDYSHEEIDAFLETCKGIIEVFGGEDVVGKWDTKKARGENGWLVTVGKEISLTFTDKIEKEDVGHKLVYSFSSFNSTRHIVEHLINFLNSWL